MYIDKNSEEFADNNVYSKLLKPIRTHLYTGWKRLFATQITQEAAEALECISIFDEDLKDLEFLKYFPNVKEISLSGKGGSLDIKAVRYTLKLETFSVFDVQIDDFTPLTNCCNLGSIDYLFPYTSCNMKTDFSFLKKLPNLWQIDFTGQNIVDTSVFIHNKKLKELVLSDNPILRLEGLAELPDLQWLELDNCKLTSLEGIEKLKSLKKLFAEGNQFTDEQKEMYRTKFSFLEEIQL